MATYGTEQQGYGTTGRETQGYTGAQQGYTGAQQGYTGGQQGYTGGQQGYTGEEGYAGEQQGYGKGAMGTTGGMGGVSAGGYGRVILTIKSAHNLRDKAWIGKADPYCEIRLADATISTHHVPNAGEHATWDESFAFNNVSPDDVIEFHVYDKNRVRKDAHMGEGTLMLRDVFQQGRLETRVPLSTRTGTKDAGEVWVSLRTEGGSEGGYGKEMGTTGAGYGQEKDYGTQGYGQQYGTTEGREREGMYGTTGTTTTGTGQGVVCDQQYFTKVEDRPLVREQVTYIKEHRPFEKEFVKETRPTGIEREAMEGRTTEHLGTAERMLAAAIPKSPCD